MLEAIIQGIVQGLSEFLPISSSGHLILVQQLFNQDINKNFVASIHLGTLLSLTIYFSKDLKDFIKKLKKQKNFIQILLSAKLKNLVIATILTIIGGLIIKKLNIEDLFSNLLSIGIASILFSLLMYFLIKSNKQTKQEINLKDSILISISQLIAGIIPGTSRSGIALTMSALLNIKNEMAINFIFLISFPIIFLSAIYSIFIEREIRLDFNFFIALFLSFAFGNIAIVILKKITQKNILTLITLYRIFFGIICIIVWFFIH